MLDRAQKDGPYIHRVLFFALIHPFYSETVFVCDNPAGV